MSKVTFEKIDGSFNGAFRSSLFFVICVILLLGCSTTGSKRIFLGVGSGLATGAAGGIVFSPNSESTVLNALVFGLAAGLVGGSIAALTDTSPKASSTQMTLKENDLGLKPFEANYAPKLSDEIPGFVKDRLKPLVVEEYVQQEVLSDDGTLHEAHKVYRIKRGAELIPLRGLHEKEAKNYN